MYKKMTFIEFLNSSTPEQIKKFTSDVPFEIRLDMASDPGYTVRVDSENGLVEFGYESDTWLIK